MLPYGDSIDVIELYGRHLKEALEHSVYELDEGKTNYQMLQVSGTCCVVLTGNYVTLLIS